MDQSNKLDSLAKHSYKNIAGLTMKGGRVDRSFLSLMEYYPDSKRWFLKSLLQVKDEKGIGGDEAITAWAKKYDLTELIIDCPLSTPMCHTCELDCPGEEICPQPQIKESREIIKDFLKTDEENLLKNPKAYENERVQNELVDYSKDIFSKETSDHMLSRAFKRKLKRGFLPYWNRPVDLWVWSHYHDQLLDLYDSSYDSFGNTSLMIVFRMSYLMRHFPKKLHMYEANANITMIELIRAGVIRKKDVINLNDFELGAEARLFIIKKIENKLQIFIYDHDLEILVKDPRAFESFLLAVTGTCLPTNNIHQLPDWAMYDQTKFLAPNFEVL